MARVQETATDIGADDIDYKKAIGADEGGLVDTAVSAVKGVAGKVADKLDPLTERYGGLFKTGLRTPVMRKPSDYGMNFEECWFPSLDGVPLEPWFIPAESDKLLIINHPMTCNRYGFPGHIPEYRGYFGGFEVNFLPELKALHDADNIRSVTYKNLAWDSAGDLYLPPNFDETRKYAAIVSTHPIGNMCFNPRPSREGRPVASPLATAVTTFQSTPLA